MKRKDKLEEKNEAFEKEINEVKNQIFNLMSSICIDMTCQFRKREFQLFMAAFCLHHHYHNHYSVRYGGIYDRRYQSGPYVAHIQDYRTAGKECCAPFIHK